MVPPEKIAEWRGCAIHSSGATVPVRWNKDLALFEVKVCKAVKEHTREAIPNVIYPADNWSPVAEYGKTIPEEVLEHYYGPRRSSGPIEHVMSANSARILAAFKDKNVKGSDEMFMKIVQETAQKKQSASSQSMSGFTDKEWEAMKTAIQEGRLQEEKLQAEKLQAEKLQAEKLQAENLLFPRHDSSCKGCHQEHPKPNIEKKFKDLYKKLNVEHPEVEKMVEDLWMKFKRGEEV